MGLFLGLAVGLAVGRDVGALVVSANAADKPVEEVDASENGEGIDASKDAKKE